MLITQKIRKEISLDNQTIRVLEILAESQGRKLKNYLENVLVNTANNLELSDEYKQLIDNSLEKHQKGDANYKSWDEYKTARKLK